MEVIGTIDEKGTDQNWTVEEVGVIDSNEVSKDTTVQESEKKPDHITETTKIPDKPDKTQKEPEKSSPEESWTIEDVAVVDSEEDQPKSVDNNETKTSKQTEEKKLSVTQKETCDHSILIDQFLERISRLEKEKEYLEGRYDALRLEKETVVTPRGDQLTMSQDHHHCCDILKDYSSLIEYITSSRDTSLEEYSDMRGCSSRPRL
ncbi:uncharacterized protein LOC144643782 [Oculina patagonica]